MTAPTPEAFLAQPPDPDEDLDVDIDIDIDIDIDVTPGAHPLLRPLQDIAEQLEWIARGPAEAEKASDRLNEAYADLEASHAQLFGLVADIEKIVKKSTSKLADQVRAAIDGWKAPAVEETVPASNAAEMGHHPPAHDADVEEWRGYARSLGYTGADIDTANRSQIRTMLGIGQTQTAGAA